MTGKRTKYFDAFQRFRYEAIANKALSSSSLQLLEHIADFFSKKTKFCVKDSIFYRATQNRRTPMQKTDFWPYDKNRSSGRLDTEEQFFLYMAEKKSTCLYEMEHKYDKEPMAVACMKILRDQNLADIQKRSSYHNYYFPREENEFYYMIVSAFHQAVAFSSPEQYRPTQIMANTLLKQGLDGVTFRSSKAPLIDNEVPLNIVLFDRFAAEAISYEEISLPPDAYGDQNQQSLDQQHHKESELLIKTHTRIIY